ncbi:MAG TPA: hypothetical protein QF423_00435 [Candidatus Scalindua sp.]|nr:hypothetical protein [Candidatus Scalindua sp.]
MGADSLRFASVGIIRRCIGAVEQTLDRVNVLRLSFKFKLKVGSLELDRQSQVWLYQESVFSVLCDVDSLWNKYLAKKYSRVNFS